MSGQTQAAVELAEAGFRVLPIWGVVHREDGTWVCACAKRQDCPNPGKHPITQHVPHGVRDATDDVEKVRSWWRLHPGANIGVATGSDLLAIDCDIRGDEDGTTNFLRLAGEQPEALPETACASTGGGGAHYFFGIDQEIETGSKLRHQGKTIPGIDIRGEGFYVVVPPSRHASGGSYVWKNHLLDGVKAAPAWLVAAVARASAPRPAPARSAAGVPVAPVRQIQQRPPAPEPAPRSAPADPPPIQGMDPQTQQIVSALGVIPATLGYTDWIERVAMPLHEHFHGSDVGFEIFHGWCARAQGDVTPSGNPAYRGRDECWRKWASFRSDHRNPKGIRTLFELAYENGWQPPVAPRIMTTPPGEQNGRTRQNRMPAPTFDREEIAGALQDLGQDPGPFPEQIASELDGPIIELIDWIMRASHRPNQTLALAAALTAVSAMFGRRVKGPGNSRPLLTLAVLAPSGGGKEAPQVCVRNLLSACPGICTALMDSTPTHQTQLDAKMLHHRGQALLMLDEYGTALTQWLSPRSMISGMSATIRRLAVYGFSVYHLAPVSSRHPDRAKNPGAWDAGIWAPALTLAGFSTPDQFYESLSESSLIDGFLGRHVVIRTPEVTPQREVHRDSGNVPDSILEWVEQVAHLPIPRTQPPSQNAMRPPARTGMPHGHEPHAAPDLAPSDPHQIEWADASAAQLMAALKDECDRAAHGLDDTEESVRAAMLRRVCGQASSIALVLALGESWRPREARVAERHVEIAYRIAKWSMDHLAFRMVGGISDERDLYGAALGRVKQLAMNRASKTGNQQRLYRSRLTTKVRIAPHLDRIWRDIAADPRFIVDPKGKWVRVRQHDQDAPEKG